jgi:1,4-dihydroxy-2-naphthoate octaprenyltransferase
VLKDLDQDRASEIKGLPQIVGKKASITIAAVLGVIALVVLVIS